MFENKAKNWKKGRRQKSNDNEYCPALYGQSKFELLVTSIDFFDFIRFWAWVFNSIFLYYMDRPSSKSCIQLRGIKEWLLDSIHSLDSLACQYPLEILKMVCIWNRAGTRITYSIFWWWIIKGRGSLYCDAWGRSCALAAQPTVMNDFLIAFRAWDWIFQADGDDFYPYFKVNQLTIVST